MKNFFLILVLLLFSRVSTAQVTTFELDSGKFIKPLMAELGSIYEDDQAPRVEYLKAIKNNQSQREIDSLRQIMRQKDQQNLAKIDGIISKYGWLGPQKVGVRPSQALFLVIQHADLKTQQRYLPMIQSAEKNAEILSSNLALLEDRINVRQGRKQLYGSQGFTDEKTGKNYTYPIADPDRLDERRKAMGLSPMAQYVKTWNLEEYKKKMPDIEKMAEMHKF